MRAIMFCALISQVMFLGVVAPPDEDNDFDGKIFLDRVCEMKEYAKTVHSQNFTDDATANGLLKNGGWYDLIADGTTLGDLKESLAEIYDLDEDIEERLVIKIYPGGEFNEDGTRRKPSYIHDERRILEPELLKMDGAILVVRYEGRKGGQKGYTREVDINCDSEYMTRTMPKVGEAIRDSYHWVDMETPIFLYLDNAGGHGTDECVEAYKNRLAEDYNVVCVHQCPRSPATNMLDLGVWMALQNVVEKLHFKMRNEKEALARTVWRGWEGLEAIKLNNVYQRWKLVLDLIIEDDGGNSKIESRRGKLYRAPSDEAEDLGDEEQTDEDVIDEMEAASTEW